ncbi:acyl carrier protein [Noviherbaspirillum cavernae]|uniref:Acyl carrier protein n=1 Tax=Noviherbaspirillum cavernae TaxID=2320862 RepID=A0A418X3M9_9BURK|nr:acyl carrier protein [Noviherbaspirillum cavernae]RJG07067.1 acyl carrier protein [Noviherbaspirillum cavernae]
MPAIEQVKNIVADTLNLGDRGSRLGPDSALLGSLPELDSMAVIHLITALEEYFGFVVHDDEISAEHFETLASLAAFVDAKLAA